MIHGRILYADAQELWLARGASLAVSRDAGRTFEPAGTIGLGPVGQLAAATRLGRRLARAGVHHLVPGEHAIAMANDGIFRARAGAQAFTRVAEIAGSRPLALASDGEMVCYGEYRGNAQRSTVHVWGATAPYTRWQPLHGFSDVRHIHGVFFDPYENRFWITTGDEDEESAIWATDDRFQTVHQVAGGSQQLRAVQLLFTRDHIYYGSDTPVAQNFIYRMERGSARIERLQPVGSSVFFGCKVGDALFLSTAVEPSNVNRTDAAQLWYSTDGETWSLLRSFPKDRLSLRYFQYGQVLFPAGPGDGVNLYFTPFATAGDQRTFSMPVADLPGVPTDAGMDVTQADRP